MEPLATVLARVRSCSAVNEEVRAEGGGPLEGLPTMRTVEGALDGGGE